MKHLLVNTIYIFISRFISAFSGLVILWLLVHNLSPEWYGYYAFVVALIGLITPLIDFGTLPILIREIAIQKEKTGKVKYFIGNALTLRLFFSSIVLIIIIIITNFLAIPSFVKPAIFIAFLTQLATGITLVFIALYTAYERLAFDTLSTAFQRITEIVILLVIFWLGLHKEFICVFASSLLAAFLAVMLSCMLASKYFISIRLNVDLNQWWYLIKESYPWAIAAFLGLASFRIGIFALQAFRGAVEVANFSAPHTFVLQLMIFPTSLVVAIFPKFSQLAKDKEDFTLFTSTYRSAFKLIFLLGLFIKVTLLILAPKIVCLFFKEKLIYADSILRIISISVPFLFLEYLNNYTLTSLGQQVKITFSQSICLFLNFLLNLILVKSYGYLGASIAVTISYVMLFFTSYYFVAQLNVKVLFSSTIFKPILTALVTALLYLVFNKWHIILLVAVGFVFYTGLALILGTFSKEELNRFRALFSLDRKKI